MTGMMMTQMNNVAARNMWTGTTTGLQINYLNAPFAGSTWADESGNNRNGTIYTIGTGSGTYASGNKGGLTFGPSNNTNAAMLANTSYNLSVPFSIEVVANIAASSFWAALWGNENYNASTGWFAYWSGSGSLTVGSPSRTNIYSITASTGSIRQFIVTVDATPSVNLYVNGALQTPLSSGYTLAPSAASSGLNFGSRHPNAGTTGTPNDCANGTYYQMRAYNIALNQSQVTANYNAIKSTYGI